MTTIAIVGGTGTLGRLVDAELTRAGHATRVLSRNAPEHRVDLVDGSGLDAALEGVDVVIDASNAPPHRPGPVLVDAQPGLLAAELRAGVAHHVCVSILGIERVPTRYYRAKVAQEAAVRAGGVPFSIVRSTQFHELIDWGLATFARLRLRPARSLPMQPVAAAEVAALVARAAQEAPTGETTTIAGPQVLDLPELVRPWAAAHRRRAIPLPLPFPPRIARPLKAGALTLADPDVRGTTTFAAWLQTS